MIMDYFHILLMFVLIDKDKLSCVVKDKIVNIYLIFIVYNE